MMDLRKRLLGFSALLDEVYVYGDQNHYAFNDVLPEGIDIISWLIQNRKRFKSQAIYEDLLNRTLRGDLTGKVNLPTEAVFMRPP
jgi:hypothetical protein